MAETDPHWDDLRAVLAVVRGQSLAAAGAELRVNYTTVARRIARAERALGQHLFERLPEGYRPTAAALTIADHAAQMEQSADGLLRQISGQDDRLEGPLIVTAPQLLIAHFLAPALQEFVALHPDVDLRVRASNDLLDLNRREADIAIRISRNPGDNLKGLRVAPQYSASFASTDLAAQIAQRPADPVNWLVYEGYGKLPEHVRQTQPNARVLMQFNDMVAMAGAAQAGMGVVRMPLFLGRRLGLVQVAMLPPEPYPDIWVVAHPDVWPSAKLQAFRDRLIPLFKKHRALFTIAEGHS